MVLLLGSASQDANAGGDSRLTPSCSSNTPRSSYYLPTDATPDMASQPGGSFGSLVASVWLDRARPLLLVVLAFDRAGTIFNEQRYAIAGTTPQSSPKQW